MIMTANNALFVVAIVGALVMGFAIQRGATCIVAAVDEVVKRGRAERLSAMVEASLWVLGCLLLGNLFGLTMLMPHAYGTGVGAVAGGALLGIGAAINRACVFGAVARFGSGEWGYLGTPIGFYLGCLVMQSAPASWTTATVAGSSLVFSAPVWVTALLGLWMLWRALLLFRLPSAAKESGVRTPDGERLRDRTFLWTPRAATITIGLSFFVMLVVAGPWAYTDVLAELAQMPSRGLTANLARRFALLIALLAGTVTGGWTAGRLRQQKTQRTSVFRCLSGGVLMGAGGTLIPGGNDGLLLIGLPLLLPYALVALTTMCVTIALWLIVERMR